MVRFVLIVEVHGGGRIVEHRQQILLHVPHRGGVLCQRFQHEADVVGVQLFQPTAYHFGRLVISGDTQHLAFGGTGIHKQVYDLVDGVLIVRAEPEQDVHLQRLIKIILMLLPDAPGIDRVRIVPLLRKNEWKKDEKMRCSLSLKLQKQKCVIFLKYYERDKKSSV